MTTAIAPVEAPASRATVKGLEVIEVEFAESPLSTPDKPVHFQQIVKILLSDGSITYGCAWAGCGFTRDTAIAVRPHLKVHKPDVRDVSALTVGEVLELARSAEKMRVDLDRVERERDRLRKSLDEWKPRAQVAERRLNTIQRAIATTG